MANPARKVSCEFAIDETLTPSKNLLSQFEIVAKNARCEFGGGSTGYQLELGNRLFVEFYNLGRAVYAASLKTTQIVIHKEIPLGLKTVEFSTKNQNWLQAFITAYPIYRMDSGDDGLYSAREACVVRSGIQFLFDDFKGVSAALDTVLAKVKENGDIETFDSALKHFVGESPKNWTAQEINDIPREHWWWY